MHEMLTILVDVRGVCQSVCLSRGLNRRRRVQCMRRGRLVAAFDKLLWPFVRVSLCLSVCRSVCLFVTRLKSAAARTVYVPRPCARGHSVQPMSNYFDHLLHVGSIKCIKGRLLRSAIPGQSVSQLVCLSLSRGRREGCAKTAERNNVL